MEVNFIEVEEVSIKTCRCCLFFSEEPMDDIFECEYAEIELQEILNLLAPIEITPDDGKYINNYFITKYLSGKLFQDFLIIFVTAVRSKL